MAEEQYKSPSNIDSAITMEEKEIEAVIRDEKSNDSDVNSEYLSCNEEQINTNSNSSPFYESSECKIDYAVKIDDNDTLSDVDDIKTDTASADSEDSALGSLPPDGALTYREEYVQDRSDGSDSGLGSETPDDVKLPSFNLSLPTEDKHNRSDKEENNIHLHPLPNCTNQENVIQNSNTVSDKPQRSSLKRKNDSTHENVPQVKRVKHNIQFDNVTVYYFPRAQGFSCVPSQGGSTLGMEWEHTHIQKFTLPEHAMEQRRLHRQVLQQLKSERHLLQGVSLSSSEDSDTEEEASDISESELDLDSYYFLQPVPTRQRRALLRAAGVRKIEGYEKDECRDIRTSREFCGCACKGVCNPDNCSCSMAGIKCQVDRLNFPCGCTREGCGNTTGRVEFNPMRVRTHFINTLMRIGLEKKNEENQEAAKRKWVEAHNSIPTTCISNAYEKTNCHSHQEAIYNNNLQKLGTESCISSSSLDNLSHMHMSNNTQSDMTFSFGGENIEHRNIKTNMLSYDDKSEHHIHNIYTPNIHQVKGASYAVTNAMEFNTMTNNMQRYTCDLNYTYDQIHLETHQFKGLQNISASSFEEFAHNSQMSMLNQYGHMYDYTHKPSTSISEHNSLHYQAMPQHYEMYKNAPECVNVESKAETHYTTLLTMPYQQNNKLQAVENDENWFSQNTLLNLDHSVPVTEESQVVQPELTVDPVDGDASDTSENFGELIKKTMVESVTV